jgi:hypothetical protein
VYRSSYLEVVERYRRAARTVIDADRPRAEKNVALVGLAKSAQAEEDRGTSRSAQEVVWREAKKFWYPDAPPESPGDPVLRAARTLRSRGYTSCPKCFRAVLTELDEVMILRTERSWWMNKRIHREAVDQLEVVE